MSRPDGGRRRGSLIGAAPAAALGPSAERKISFNAKVSAWLKPCPDGDGPRRHGEDRSEKLEEVQVPRRCALFDKAQGRRSG